MRNDAAAAVDRCRLLKRKCSGEGLTGSLRVTVGGSEVTSGYLL